MYEKSVRAGSRGLSLVRKVGPRRIKRTVADYFRLYRSRKAMTDRLTEESRQHPVRQRNKGVSVSQVAADLCINARHVRRLWARFQETGTTRARMGRPRACMTGAQIRLVADAHGRRPVGAVRTARGLRKDHDISYCTVYWILKKGGAVAASAAKPGRRRRVRHELGCPNAMWHAGWHDMKDSPLPRFRGLRRVTYLDDASRCVAAARVFTQATSENAVLALREAIAKFGTPATILSDNGSCFVGRSGRRDTPFGSWRPTASEAELLDSGIELINSGPYPPRLTAGWSGSTRAWRTRYGTTRACQSTEYYNEERLHLALDIDNYQTPLKAFHDKRATDATRENDPKWMGMDTDD